MCIRDSYDYSLLFFINRIKGKVIIDYRKTNAPACQYRIIYQTKLLWQVCLLYTSQRTKDKKLRDFQTKLANLRWLDPASGSGNFLTETYISLSLIHI